MLWQVHECHIAKLDFPQFPDEVYYSTYMFFYTLLKITLQPTTKSLVDPTEMAGVKQGAQDAMCLEPQVCFLLFTFLCLLNDHQQHLCFVFCFFFHYHTISINSSVMRHKPSGFGQNWCLAHVTQRVVGFKKPLAKWSNKPIFFKPCRCLWAVNVVL